MRKLKMLIIFFRFLFFVIEKEGSEGEGEGEGGSENFEREGFKWWFTACIGNLIWLMISLGVLRMAKMIVFLYGI